MVPETLVYGERGEAKFPHAVAFHGIQVFILTAAMLRRGMLREPSKKHTMRLVAWSYTGLLVFATVQTIAGRAVLDVTVWTLGMAASLVTLAYGLVRSIRSFTGRGIAGRGITDPTRAPPAKTMSAPQTKTRPHLIVQPVIERPIC